MRPGWPPLIHAGVWLVLAISSGALQAMKTAASSTEYLVNVWSSEHGLPHNAILSLAQTPDGYIWVGTRSGGLAWFDGVRFVPFHPQNTGIGAMNRLPTGDKGMETKQ